MVVQTNKGSVKLFGATIEVATVWENNRPEKQTSNLYEEAKVRRKRGEQEAATPREKESESTGAAPSVKTEQKEVAASKRVRVPLYPTKEKPSKVLCCPRCHSLNTKFCYFNNYNANQPRHFCRACQRYWTDGGVMRRTMPVGAGRRKSKSNSSHRSHLTIYGAAALQNIPSSIVEACGHHHPQQATDKANNASSGDGVLPPNRDDGVWNPTKASSMTTCSSIIKEEPRGGFHVFQDPCLRTGCPFPSTWNPPHAFSASSHLPLSFYLTQNTTCFISQLGTHSRDGSSRIGNPNNHVETDEEDMWLRKAMRIDDPNGAFKCSKWNGAMGEDETSSRESHL